MKIIAGEYKGRHIDMPRGADIRPTSDKVREALFNIMMDKVAGSCVLDLFAGSGAFGIEALSRGAGHAVFVDLQKKCADCVRANLRGLAISKEKYDIYCNDAFKALKKLSDTKIRFNIVFLDPPYHEGLLKKSLIYLCNHDILYPSSLVICEHFKKDEMPDEIDCLVRCREARYGDTVLSFYTRRNV